METAYIIDTLHRRLTPESIREIEESEHCTAVSAADLPGNLSGASEIRMRFALLTAADRVIMLPQMPRDIQVQMELDYCHAVDKPVKEVMLSGEAEQKPQFTEQKPQFTEQKPQFTEQKPQFTEQKRTEPKKAAGMSHVSEEYRGFVYIRCPKCGKEHAFCAREPLTRYVCRVCGTSSPLPPPTKVYLSCECGNKSKYRTNIEDWCFDIPCIECGAPCPVEYHPGKEIYVPAGSLGTRNAHKRKRDAK